MAKQELVMLSPVAFPRLPLSEAVWHFAPASLKKEARRVTKLEYRKPTLPDVKEASVLSVGLVFLAALGDLGGQWTEKQKPWADMRAELRRRLYERELEAFGIMAAPELRHYPEKISNRPRQFPFYSEEHLVTAWLQGDELSDAGKFMHAVKTFLAFGHEKVLKPFEGQGARDIQRKFHTFETDPNVLYELDNAGELSFPEIYKIAA